MTMCSPIVIPYNNANKFPKTDLAIVFEDKKGYRDSLSEYH